MTALSLFTQSGVKVTKEHSLNPKGILPKRKQDFEQCLGNSENSSAQEVEQNENVNRFKD